MPDILTQSDEGEDSRGLVPGCMKHYLPVSAAPLSLGELNEKSAAVQTVLLSWLLFDGFEESANSTRSLWGWVKIINTVISNLAKYMSFSL